MAPTLQTFLPSTRSGRTFFIALSLLGAVALLQLLALGAFLVRAGGIAPRPATEIHFAESLPANGVSTPNTPIRSQPSQPTPAPASAEPVASTENPVLTRPTPAPAARYQAGSGDLLDQARQLRARGDMNSALARLREAQVAEPDNAQVIAEMALTYEAMQIPDRAFEQWQRLYNLGEGVGALYFLADAKLHSAPKSSPALATTQANAPTANDAAILKLTDIHREDQTDPSVDQKISLKIVVKNRPGTAIDPKKVRILTYFYDLVDGKDMVLTDAQTDFAWLSTAPVNWAGDKSEVLETVYTRPKPAPVPVAAKEADAPRGAKGRGGHRGKGDADVASPSPASAATPPVRVYGGYTVSVYYDRQLQDAQGDPVALLQQYRPPVTISNE